MAEINAASGQLTPYAHSLGIAVDRVEGGVPVLVVDFSNAVEGRPGALHGGAISGLLETAGYAALRGELDRIERKARLKPINITVEFLSAGKPRQTFSKARITKLGRRTANLVVEAWQVNRDRPIASAVMNVMVKDEEP
ncbi:PaaI family thioesterase [Qipengyuania algicida]|uniref:PaaI family thioesterase n=1 Tax=Qipengyuania algicida TaxID=1836209 RepID=UPI00301C5E61